MFRLFSPTNRRPLIVTLVALLFVITGIVGLAYHTLESLESTTLAYDNVWVLLLRVLAILIGLFMLRGANWARWLAIVWIAYHVAISLLHSLSEVLIHLAFLVVIVYLLMRPKASAYFRVTDRHEGDPR